MKIKDKEIIIKKGDITEETSDAIVNPANSHLMHGGGAARAIAVKGGNQIDKESREIIKKIKYIPVGKAVITNNGNLKCKYVIHTVGPRMGEGNEDEKLKNAVWNSLTLADLYNLESISLPAISSGIFGFPKDRCAEILLSTSMKFLKEKNTSIKKIIMCNFDEETCNIFREKESFL
ncbi:O-acetyl-ADP-ribose deacetylase [Clostridium acetireducens DSM 10703]|uniref:O-acetyl-ADP-ribose deacetylase n=1 Tax=Clostridium acetireducens DSM 10703 TaxID=1121290 RepID=A0A1E8F195_9CLOT|nr:macro domain-containing protein [Clostridium acetireducens]OFI06954.1 O-acetyl-ADP-ribose deacetylase [Clostridium acetireducens DSM 10703]